MQRIKNNPDFTYLNQQVELLKELRNDTTISLNIETREIERKETEKKRLDLENQRRIAKGMKPLETLKAGEDDKKDKSQDKSEDALLKEGGEILVDFMKLGGNTNGIVQK